MSHVLLFVASLLPLAAMLAALAGAARIREGERRAAPARARRRERA
jgi:hypothetical protein